MTDAEMLPIYVRLAGDLYEQLELEQAEHAATKAEVDRLKDDAVKRELSVAALHDHIAVLERPARVPSCGHPPL